MHGCWNDGRFGDGELTSRPILSIATEADFAEYTRMLFGQPSPVPMRTRAFVARLDGRILGIGGIGFMPDGTRIAFCDLTKEAYKFPVTMHKAARRTMDLAMKLGIKRLVATTETNHPAAHRWLARLDFAPTMVNGIKVYVRDF
jgi:hypothetical protein